MYTNTLAVQVTVMESITVRHGVMVMITVIDHYVMEVATTETTSEAKSATTESSSVSVSMSTVSTEPATVTKLTVAESAKAEMEN